MKLLYGIICVQLTPHVDEIVTDGLGGIFGVKHSTAADAPRILVAAHMDEVGFMISEIKADGTFRVVPIGVGIRWLSAANASKLFTRDGCEYPAISGSVPPSFDTWNRWTNRTCH